MSAHQRYSDENLNPQDDEPANEAANSRLVVNDEPKVVKQLKTETENTPLTQSNDNKAPTSSKRLTTFERKDRNRFQYSGMKSGALLKYLTTKTDTKKTSKDTVQPSTSRNSMSQQKGFPTTKLSARVSILGNNGTRNHTVAGQIKNISTESADIPNSQESGGSVQCLGEFQKVVKESELVDISSEAGEVSNEDSDSRRSENEVSSNESVEDPPGSENHDSNLNYLEMNVESSISLNETTPMTAKDRVEHWQRVNKRLHNNDDNNGCPENETLPPKIGRFNLNCNPVKSNHESTPPSQETSPSASSYTSSCPKIVEVFTLGTKRVTVRDTSASTSSTSTSNESEKIKRALFAYSEYDNVEISRLMDKKIFKKALQLMNIDLANYKLPKPIYVSKLIRNGILCENARVAKVVQNESMEFLEKLVKVYPPQNGSGRDVSLTYYKEIFEQVYEDPDDNSDSGERNDYCKLFNFLQSICEQVESDTSRIDMHVPKLLFLVTRLAINQYKVYDCEKLKVKPPLFQYFLDDGNGMFKYNSCCRRVVAKLFSTPNSNVDLICIYMGWANLIAKRLGSVSLGKKEYWKLVSDIKEKCLRRDDLGLRMIMNFDYEDVAKDVCERIFDDKLVVIPKFIDSNSNVSDVERNSYLTELAQTMLIVPASKIISDVKEHNCEVDTSLIYKTTTAEALVEERSSAKKLKSDRKKNLKGETRLHKICGPSRNNGSNSVNEEIKELVKHIRMNPNDINATDNFGNTPLHDCARNDKGHLINKLMQLNASGQIPVPVNLLAYNRSLETPMHLAATFCSTQNADILKSFARDCGVMEDILLTPNKDGKLPFELTGKDNLDTRNKLLPHGYNIEEMLVQSGFTLASNSIKGLKNSFALRKLLAWWSKNCMQ